MCRGIITEHGGRSWAENQSDGGVALRLTLPVPETPLPIALEMEASDSAQRTTDTR
jgi:K+-sensing histidine kinase KdpD